MAKLTKALVPIGIVAAAAIVAILLAQSRPEAMQKPAAPPALLVKVITVQPEPVVFTVRSHGTVTPRTRTTLVSEVAGQIVEVAESFVAGGTFHKGTVLVRIDPRNYEAALKRAEANVARARTQVATENALAGYAYDDWLRMRDTDSAAKPPSELTLRKPQLAQALAELDSSEAELAKARGDLDRTVIRAPYQGMVREKLADLGQYVSPATPLATTFAIDRAEVRLPITEKDLAYLDLPDDGRQPAAPVVLTSSVGGVEHRWQARLVRTEGVFDAESRVIHVVAEVEQPYRTDGGEPLRVGTFVNAEVEGRAAGDLFVLPRHALYRNDTVWIVDDDLQAQPRSVTVVRRDDRSVFIADGIEAGNRVCISPIQQPLPGMPVRIEADG